MLKKLITIVAGLSFFCSASTATDDNYNIQNSENPFERNNALADYGFNEFQCNVFNEKSEIEALENFFIRSKQGNKAREYVENKLEEVKGLDDGKLTGLELATLAVDILRKDISRSHGNGLFTSKHEIPDYLEFMKKFSDGWKKKDPGAIVFSAVPDSTQTMDMFLSHPSKKYEGDCDDFSSALLVSYELMKDMSSTRNDSFHSRLSEGLKRHMLLGMTIQNHAMNVLLTYDEDYSSQKITPIEPQFYDYGSDTKIKGLDIRIKGNRLYLLTDYGQGKVQHEKIISIYSSRKCYYNDD